MKRAVQITWQRDDDGIQQPISTEIDFEDYERMGTEMHAAPLTRKWPAPPWALSNAKIRAVILARLRRYVWFHPAGGDGRRGAQPSLDAPLQDGELRGLEALAEKRRDDYAAKVLPRLNDFQRSLIEAEQRATKNGIAGLWARLIYERYRLGLDSPSISTKMQGAITPWAIRVHLQRLNDIARKLFPEDCNPRHATFGKPKIYVRGKNMKKATVQKHIERLQTLAARNHGVLPSYTWLNKNGYFGSYDCVRKYAPGFLHKIKRARA